MKKTIAGVVIAFMCVSAVACAKNGNQPIETSQEETITEETTTEYVTEVETTTEEITTEEITTEEVTTEEETTTEVVTTVEETTEVVTTVAPTEAPTTVAPTVAPTQAVITSGTYKGKNFAELVVGDSYATVAGQTVKRVGRYKSFDSPFVYETSYGDLLCGAEIEDIYGNNYKANALYQGVDSTGDPIVTLFATEDCVVYKHYTSGSAYESRLALNETWCGDEWFHLADGTKVKKYSITLNDDIDAYMFLSQYEFDNFYKYLDSEFVEYVKVEYPQWDAEKFSCYAGRIEAYDTNHIPNSPINNLKINEVWHDIF